MAEAILKKMLGGFDGEPAQIEVRSGGIASHARNGSDVSLDVRLLLKQEGIVVDDFRSRDIKRHTELIGEADLILTMSEAQKEKVQEFQEAVGRGVYTLREFAGETGDISDPVNEGEAAYSECKDDIERCLQKVINRLLP